MFDRVTCEGLSEAMANALIESYRMRHVRAARAEGGWVALTPRTWGYENVYANGLNAPPCRVLTQPETWRSTAAKTAVDMNRILLREYAQQEYPNSAVDMARPTRAAEVWDALAPLLNAEDKAAAYASAAFTAEELLRSPTFGGAFTGLVEQIRTTGVVAASPAFPAAEVAAWRARLGRALAAPAGERALSYLAGSTDRLCRKAAQTFGWVESAPDGTGFRLTAAGVAAQKLIKEN